MIIEVKNQYGICDIISGNRNEVAKILDLTILKSRRQSRIYHKLPLNNNCIKDDCLKHQSELVNLSVDYLINNTDIDKKIDLLNNHGCKTYMIK